MVQKKPNHKSVVICSLFFTIAVSGLAILMALTSPLRPFEVFLYLFFWSALATFALMYFLPMEKWLFIPPKAENIENISVQISQLKTAIKTALTIKILIFISVACLFIYIMLAANKWLDASPAEKMTLPVTGKHIHDDEGSISYLAEVRSPIPSYMPFGISMNSYENIVVSNQQEYDRVLPGHSQVTVSVHKGYLGFPWYESGYHITHLASENVSNISPALIKEACQWRQNFTVARDIEPLPPQGYQREHWPNGALKSEEPLVNGQIHGIGKYWFDNGARYGEIPYNHGKKHGYFMLYRADGNKDQSLSYKDGHPFGLCEWYKEDGSLKERYLMVDEHTALPASKCDYQSPSMPN